MHLSCDLESLKDIRATCKTLDLPTNFKVETLKFTTELHIILLPLELISRVSPPSLRILDYTYLDRNRPDENKSEILHTFLGSIGAELEDITIQDSMDIQGIYYNIFVYYMKSYVRVL